MKIGMTPDEYNITYGVQEKRDKTQLKKVWAHARKKVAFIGVIEEKQKKRCGISAISTSNAVY